MKRKYLTIMAMGLVGGLWAEAPKPYIHWKMENIANGVIVNAGTNTDSRCSLTVGAGTCITNIQGFGNALCFDAANAPGAAWATSWSPGVRSRTLAFWIYRPATDDGIDTKVNKNHYVVNGHSYMNVMCGPGSGDVNLKVGVNESTAEQIAHTYFYKAFVTTRGSWHHMAIVLEDTGTVENSDANYMGCPIYEMRTYLDGAPHKSETRTLECDPFREGVFMVGNNAVNGTRPVPGALSDMRFYDTALTANEIQELFLARMQELRGELLAWYPMDRIDSSGAVRTTPEMSGRGIGSAMEVGTSVSTTPGPDGTALQFDATSTSWGTTTLSFTGLPVLDHTVSFWMYVPRGFEALCGSLSSHMARIYVLGASRFMFNSNDEYADASTKADLFLFHDNTKFSPANAYLEKGCWVHMAISVESACDYTSGTAAYSVKPTVYADGAKAYEGSWTATPGTARMNAALSLYLANNAKSGMRGLYGAMADFRIYRGALTSNEVTAVYRGTALPDAGADFAVAREWAELRGRVTSRSSTGCYGLAYRDTQLAWSLVSAPAGGEGAAIVTPAGEVTRVRLPVPGAYTFRLTATNMGAARSDEVVVTRLPEGGANVPPVVSAGAELTTSVGVSTALTATMSDADNGPGTLRGRWNLVSGAGGVWFADARTASTSAIFSAPGNYTLRFTADDGLAAAGADVAVTVAGTAVDPASTLTNGLIGHWPVGYGEMKDMVTGTAITRDFDHTRLDSGLDGHGFRGDGETSSLITGLTPQESGTAGNRAQKESEAGTFRSFSFWMYHDTANPGTNAVKSICLISQPYTMGLWYTPEDGFEGNSKLFQMYQQSMNKDEDGNTITGGGGTLYFGCPDKVPTNCWTHVYVVFDRYNPAGSNLSALWIDGVRQTPKSGTLGFARINSSYLTFAGMNANRVTDHTQNGYWTDSDGKVLSRTLPGWMDDIRMYNRILSEEEIVYLATHPALEENRGPSVGFPNAADGARVAHKKPLALTTTAAGDPLPSSKGLSYEWRVVDGNAANVTFADAAARETTAVFARAGNYAVQLAVSDGERTTYSDLLVVEVPEAGMVVSFR